MTALDDDTLTHITKREGEDGHGTFSQLGVIGHGLCAAEPAVIAQLLHSTTAVTTSN